VEPDGKILVNLTRGNILCEQIEIADRAGRRMRGLLGRESLDPGTGMLLQPAPSIHTAFMRFAIDVVFMDGTLRVTKIVRGLGPWRMAGAHRSWGVVELAAGEVERRGVAIGDQLGVVEVTDKLGAIVVGPGGISGLLELAGDSRVGDASRNGNDSHDGSPHPDGKADTGTRVLLVGSDRRFRSVAAALLTQRGCAVTLGDPTANIGSLARSEGAEVVVIDAGVSLTNAAHGAAQIETLDPPVGIVVVGEEGEQSFSTMPVLPKWGSFDGLYKAIENARASRTLGSWNGNRS
jgi:uncharacterized protein